MRVHKHDCLVIGGGGAGMRAVVALAEQNVDVGILSKVYPDRSHTVEAEGGAAAEMRGSEADIRSHEIDTIRGGVFLNDQDTVRYFVREAPTVIEEIERCGCIWDRNEDGSIASRPFGGMSHERTLRHGDSTGRSILRALTDTVRSHENIIHTYYEFFVTDIFVANGRCIGAAALDLRNATMHFFRAKTIIIATGGAGAVFQFTTNAKINSGDGMALAYNAGIPLMNMEFMQYHPTCVVHNGYLITEGVRGDGGRLLNARNERFIEKYVPESATETVVFNKMEMRCRDEISRIIYQEIRSGNGVHTKSGDAVLLDISHKAPDFIKNRLGEMYKNMLHYYGIDMTKEGIPVRPGVHYTMGGIACDVSTKTPVAGIFAAGEAACNGLHGANRLGSNSLTEILVFGKRAGNEAAEYALANEYSSGMEAAFVEQAEKALKNFSAVINRPALNQKGENMNAMEQRLYAIMEESAGVYRNGADLRRGCEMIGALKRDFAGMGPGDKQLTAFNQSLVYALELRSKITVAETILHSAMERLESRGAHQRADYPETDNVHWLKHSLAYANGEGSPNISYRHVRILDTPPEEHRVTT